MTNIEIDNNIFLNKEKFSYHHDKKYRDKRINDFKEIYEKLKNHLKPNKNQRAEINEKELHNYINLYKEENKELIKEILNKVQYISFNKFYTELKNQIEIFNKYLKTNKIEKYIYVLGVGKDLGSDTVNFNLFKSNFWVFLLSWEYLEIKPYDIILNFNTAIRLYYNEIKEYLLLDDCSYSGDQLFNNVIKNASIELMYYKKDSYLISDVIYRPIFKPVQEKYLNLHLIIPYMSILAYDKIKNIELTTGFNIINYTSYIINNYDKLFDINTLNKINTMYQQYVDYVYFGNLIPLFFEHKIADNLSTIDIILIKGQVLDDPKKRLVFIDNCKYIKENPDKEIYNPDVANFNYRKIYCPLAPYLYFEDIIYNKN